MKFFPCFVRSTSARPLLLIQQPVLDNYGMLVNVCEIFSPDGLFTPVTIAPFHAILSSEHSNYPIQHTNSQIKSRFSSLWSSPNDSTSRHSSKVSLAIAYLTYCTFGTIGLISYPDRYHRIVPPMVVLLCKDPSVKKADLSSVRYALVGAAPLSTELTQQFLTLMPNMQFGQGYGMTENTAAASIVRFPFGFRLFNVKNL